MLQPIHPFPARMAPEIVHRTLETAKPKDRVLDPMCGSGAVIRAAVEHGHSALGVDIDPLAVLMSRVWTAPVSPQSLTGDASAVVTQAQALQDSDIDVPSDPETYDFMCYWFAEPQFAQLARLATVIGRFENSTKDTLAICMSRVIITKEMKAVSYTHLTLPTNREV